MLKAVPKYCFDIRLSLLIKSELGLEVQEKKPSNFVDKMLQYVPSLGSSLEQSPS
jgi:hypothetical protein